MSLKKQCLKKLAIYQATFTVPKKLADIANIVYLVGDFNDWNRSVKPTQASAALMFSLVRNG